MELGSATARHLLFLPGFLTPAGAYRQLLAPVAAAGTAVTVPQLYRPSPAVLMGRFTTSDEAQAAVALTRGLGDGGAQVFLGGHSRGGQAAWLAAQQLRKQGIQIDGLLLLDPVDGGNPRSPQRVATARPTDFGFEPLIIGAGAGGKCAPAAVNHEWFAKAVALSRHVVIQGMGHADVLNGVTGDLARRLCGGSTLTPHEAREQVSAVFMEYIEEHDSG